MARNYLEFNVDFINTVYPINGMTYFCSPISKVHTGLAMYRIPQARVDQIKLHFPLKSEEIEQENDVGLYAKYTQKRDNKRGNNLTKKGTTQPKVISGRKGSVANKDVKVNISNVDPDYVAKVVQAVLQQQNKDDQKK